MRGFTLGLSRVVVMASLLTAQVVAAQSLSTQSPDARWQPWLGCWMADVPRTAGVNEPMVCVVPEVSGTSVELAVIANNKVAHREVISATGVRAPKIFDTCPGWESASFSKDGRRLFLRSEFTCDKAAVQGSGVFAISDVGEWIEVRGSMVSGRSTVRAVRYRPAGRTLQRLAAEAASDSMPYAIVNEREAARYQRFEAGTPLSTDAVLEVTRSVQTPVAEAWLNELRQGFTLNGSELVRLADAGMPSNVLDLMVALSYPRRFAVERAALEQGGGGISIERPRTMSDDVWNRRARNCGYGYSPMYLSYLDDPCYSGYGVYGYDPYGYSLYGRYGYGYGYNGYGGYGGYGGYNGYYGGYYFGSRPIIIVNSTTDQNVQQRGRAVNGAGYTRGSPGTATSSGPRASANSPSGGGSSSGGSSSSSGSSSSGSSSSGSSSSSGRTAKPRPPG